MRRRLRWSWRPAGTALVLLAGSLAMSPADAVWTPIQTLTATGWVGDDWPAVATDRQGDALLAWGACPRNANPCEGTAQVRLRSATGGLGPLRAVSIPGNHALWPRTAVDDNGEGVVVWIQDGTHVVGRRVSAIGVPVGQPRTLSDNYARVPEVAVAPPGHALVVWPRYRTSDGEYDVMARFFYADGSIGTTFSLGPGSVEAPGIAFDRRGMAVVAWTDARTKRVLARRVKPGYVSGTQIIATAPAGVGYGRVTASVDADGDALVTMRRAQPDGARVWARRWDRTGRLGAVQQISPTTDRITFYHDVQLDLEGDGVVVWSRRTSQTRTDVFARQVHRTGGLGPIVHLGIGDRPQVALDDTGDGSVVWHSPGPPYDARQVISRRVNSAGVFGTATTLTQDGRIPAVAASPGGSLTVIWQQRSAFGIQARFGP
jgi:hypothetical protein